jgi:cytochrome c553
MKRLIFLLVILGFWVSGTYAASIVNSAHDLSGSSTFVSPSDSTTKYGSTQTDRLCVFCHTPHYALTVAPLWNRNSDNLSTATKYTSSTFNFTPDYTSGDVPLCMSCHDGDMTDSLVNLNGAPSVLLTPFTGRSLAIPTGAAALLGTDFTNDHPVGFTYDSTLDAQNGLVATTDAGVQALLRGTNEVWCASCHNVHDPGTDVAGKAPFLRVSNTNSALCLTCHLK